MRLYGDRTNTITKRPNKLSQYYVKDSPFLKEIQNVLKSSILRMGGGYMNILSLS